ncbi:MAG: hypothetical protein WCX69_01080 [Candidatus Paceibacterota bacterium]
MSKNFLIAAVVCFFAVALPVSAHLPYLEGDKEETVVADPEVSRAYYGWLSRRPAAYLIDSRQPFSLYLNLLAPQIENARLDFSMKIYKDGDLLETRSGADAFWQVDYEPFANDYYLKGPEYEAQMPAGNYEIEIYNSGNSGNYVLAVGKKEDLSFGQFLRTLAVLPQVKQEFWGKPIWQAYNNFIGLAAFILLVFSLVAIYFIVSFVNNHRLKIKLDDEYKNNRSTRGADRRGSFAEKWL